MNIKLMKTHPQNITRSAHRGFTLVEVLVVMAMIAVLAMVVLTITRRVQQSAQASNRLSNMRQAGSMLLGLASENNGRCSYYAGGSEGWDYRPYLILLKELGLSSGQNYNVNEANRVTMMHWDLKKLPPPLPHWNCRAINFMTVTYPDGTTTRWTEEEIKNSSGTTARVKSISLASVSRPADYPLLIDSSKADGDEIFRINEANGDCVGLREVGGKASAYFFDGSARLVGKPDLKRFGFKKAYDNSTKPPKAITLQ
jgi:prepilin-type N-terminal cleavage/methylation domain-containing protein